MASIIFCNDIQESPIQIDPLLGDFQNKKLQALLTRLGQEHKLALFCHSPLLVEGPSDEIICSALSKKLSLNLEAAGSQILPVTGKGQFPVVIKLFRLIGKVPALLADADAIVDNLDIISVFTNLPKANETATALGHRDAAKFAKDIYNDFCQIIKTKWTDIKVLAEQHYYWINRDKNKDELIAKRRSAFCWLFNTNDEVITKVPSGSEWLTIKVRLLSLLAFLEKLGCFVLRKGTIETYYQHSGKLTVDEKPNAASYEVNCLLDETDEKVKSDYDDIIRAMRFCSNVKEINEAESIRDLLLAMVSPALATVKKETTDVELEIFSNNLLGAKSSLFTLSKQMDGDDIYIEVNLSTHILEVCGFPIKIKKGANPVEVVNSSLKLN